MVYDIDTLTGPEADVLESIINMYKLPFGLILDVAGTESDFIIDEESHEKYDLTDGIDYILEAVNCDDRELLKKKCSVEEIDTFLNLCRRFELV